MKINIGDVVEIKYRHIPKWDGIQFRVTKHDKCMSGGIIVKTPPSRAKANPVGSEFTWSGAHGLVVVKPKNDQPTENQVYIDHIFERLLQNATPEELISLAERLDRAGKGISLPK